MIFSDVSQTVGKTPLVNLTRLNPAFTGRMLGKLEMRNPCGSIKDRLGVALIKDAETRGVLKPGGTIVEATGGNTGIGLAFAAAVGGYRLILAMPETMSKERVSLLRYLGAEVHLTPGILMSDALLLAKQLAESTPGAVLMDQFTNPANSEIHRVTTAQEIWSDTHGQVDIFVSAIGTAGTLMGVGRFLKEHRPDVKLVAVEPRGAAVLSGGSPGQHRIPGIGVGFVPPLLDTTLLDEVIAVEDEEALAAARNLARKEGISAGVSSGAAIHAAIEVSNRSESRGKSIVVILPDTGDRYSLA